MKDKGLYEKILAFEIDEGPAALSFSKRLSRENGWSIAFAERVVGEYKRFVYLAMVADHAVTPSDEVDQAWHLHMLYTRSYFDRLCGDVLGRQLAHGPTKGGKAEGEKYANLYERTKQLYATEFGCDPPIDVWPSSEVRFGDAPFFRRVNTRENFVVSKRLVAVASVLVVITLFLVGCTSALAEATPLKPETVFIIVFLGLIAFIGLLVYVVKKYGSNPGSGSGSGCGGASGCTSGSGDGGSGCGSGCGGGGCGGCS
jgi:hypothetical protein